MKDPSRLVPGELRAHLRRRSQPSWLSPMLATLYAGEPPEGGWVFEPKFDGVRCLVFRKENEVRLLSRNRLSLNGGFPELVEAFREQPARDFIADTEIVAFEGRVTSFSRLQGRLGLRDPVRARQTGIAVYGYVFDLLFVDGYLLTGLPLLERKQLLRQAFSFRGPLRYTPHYRGRGAARLEDACEKGWEGLIAKRADARYAHARSNDWLKLKCVRRQEFVIGGYTDPQGARVGFGALLVGYYENGGLRYAGMVGTGYDRKVLSDLTRRLAALHRESSPFAAGGIPRRDAHWVRPALVAEVGFTEWTRAGILRHPRFLGLRVDKKPRDVVREG